MPGRRGHGRAALHLRLANGGTIRIMLSVPTGLNLDQEKKVLRRLRWLARLLDGCFTVPGTQWRFGWDGIIGLVPVAGDVVTTSAALYIVWKARQLGAPDKVLLQMLLNVTADLVGGMVPVAGDLVDVAWKANLRNVALLEQWLKERGWAEGGFPVIDV